MSGTDYVKEQLGLMLELFERLGRLPAEILSQEYRYEFFGSWSFVILRSGQHFQVFFDGRDRVLLMYVVGDAGTRFSKPKRLVREEPFPEGLRSDTLDDLARIIAKATSEADEEAHAG